jgi:hypothetical protein
MNYHRRVYRSELFMKRSLLIMSTALSCLGLAGCSWMSQDPCSGDDADLSNPACVVQSKQTYRSNESRWFCIGHLEAKDWSCAKSLEEAQIKHDAMSDVLAQLGQRPAEMNLASNPIGLIAPAAIDERNMFNNLPKQVAPPASTGVDAILEEQSALETVASGSLADAEAAPEMILQAQDAGRNASGLAANGLTDSKNNIVIKQKDKVDTDHSLETISVNALIATVDAKTPALVELASQVTGFDARNALPAVSELPITHSVETPASVRDDVVMESVPDALIVAKATPLIDQSMRAEALTDSAPSIAQLETPLTEVSILPSGLTQVLDPQPALPEIIETKVVQIDGAKMALPLGIAEVTTDLSNDVAAAVNAAPAAATVTATVVLVETLPATAIALAPMVISTLMPNLDAVFTSDLAGIPENSSRNKASQGASLSTDSVMQDRLSSEITQAALESDFAGTTLKVEAEISELAVALVETVARPAVVEVIDAPITAVALQAVLPVIEVETQEVEVQTEPQAVAVTLVDAIASPALTEVIEVPVTVLEAPEGLTVAEVAMPKAEIQTEAPDVADTLIEEITRPVVAAVIDTPERVVELPEVLAAVTPIEVDVEVTTLAVQAEAPELAVAVVDAATSPIAAAVIDAPMRVVKPEVLAAVAEVEMTTPEIQTDALERPGLAAEPAMASVQAEVQDIAKIVSPKVEKIATEIVVPASEPFPAGTTLAEVYTDHVQRSEQLPAQLQTLGPKGALPMPAVASTRSAQRYAVQPTPVQLNRSANSAFAQAARLAQAAPLIAAVADAAKLDSIAVSATGLDYASMAPAATSGDGTYDYFMDLPSDDFAIQLKAEKNLAALRTFAATVDLEDPLVLKTQLMKRPLYVLVLDTFNDIQLASDAKRSWMAQYNNGIEPWIRTVGSLQKTMQPIGPMD